LYSCAKQNGRQFVAGEPVALPATFSVQNENENEGMVSNMNRPQDRLREHAKAFDGLLSLIPAKMYYEQDTSVCFSVS